MRSMTKYEWDEQFYRELVIDYNYRFPKFMEINYPNPTEETNNEEGQLWTAKYYRRLLIMSSTLYLEDC